LTIDEWFSLGKAQILKNGAVNDSLVSAIIKEHGGLAWAIGKTYAKRLDYGECLSYLWESIPDAINEWDSSKGMPSTAIKLVFCRLVSRHNERTIYRGSVRIPPKRQADYHGHSLSLMDDASEYECVITSGREFGVLYGEQAKARWGQT
jgi:hypothetical protein